MIGEQPSHAVSDSVDRFLRSDAGIRTRYELAWKSEVSPLVSVSGKRITTAQRL